jgi:hypothetical protein
MSQFLKTPGILSAAIFMAAVCAFNALPARGESGYLEVAGPPPLRFAAQITNEFLLTTRFPLPQPKPEPQPESVAVSNTVAEIPASTETNAEVVKVSASTNVLSLIPPVPPATNQVSEISVSTGSSEGNNSADTSAAAGDLLTTTPQMIMQYLKPDADIGNLNRTNRPATAVFMPTWMGFMPALLSYPVENKTESRATYISK